jgi:hypothetical protein
MASCSAWLFEHHSFSLYFRLVVRQLSEKIAIPDPTLMSFWSRIQYSYLLVPLYRRLGGPWGWSGWVQLILFPWGFEPWTIQLIVSYYTTHTPLTATHNIYSIIIVWTGAVQSDRIRYCGLMSCAVSWLPACLHPHVSAVKWLKLICRTCCTRHCQ